MTDALAAMRRMESLIAGLPGVVYRFVMGRKGKVEYVSRQIADLCGVGPEHFMDQGSEKLALLIHPDNRMQVLRSVSRAARSRRPFALEHRIRCQNGAQKWVWHRGAVVRPDPGGPLHLEGFALDITERKRQERELAWLAQHDVLTGTANRGRFMEEVSACMQRAERHGEMLACLFLDIDRFKRINDTFGHAFGDELLRCIARRIRRCVRGNDVIGRLGGDEFVVLLDGITAPQDAAVAAQKILIELAAPFTIQGRRIKAGASIGISCYPGDAGDAASLLRNADAAMYSVKRTGRRAFRFYSEEMSGRAFETLALLGGLRDAIGSDAMNLCYQPRLDLRTGRVVAMEALARWHSEQYGNVPPARFIPLLEDAGMTEAFTSRVLNDACRQLSRWDAEGMPAARMAINLSARQFRNDTLPEQVEALLAEHRIAPERIEFEISELAVMEDHPAATESMHRLHRLGVRLAIDDFGSGSSSLHLLKQLPLEYLKVDRRFIAGVPSDDDDIALTEAIIAMGKRLGLRVVAEGIETEAQGVFVRANECDEGQGFLFSRPMPAEDAGEWLRRRLH